MCSRCGRKAFAADVMRNCRPGLGDMVAAGLDAVGVTKARAQAVAAAIGLEDCGCHKRQQMLNAAGRMLGIGTAPESTEERPSG